MMQTLADPLGKTYAAADLTWGTGHTDPTATCRACNDQGVIPTFGVGGHLVDEVDCNCAASYDLAS